MANVTKWDAPGLLTHLLENQPLPADFVDQVLKKPLAENLHFDCKSWSLLAKDDAREEVRRNAAAFANADGGVLVIGLHEQRGQDRKLIALTQDGDPASELADQATAVRWFSQTLENIKPWLTPPYRLSVITHNGAPLIALAVARAPNLVWCMEGKRQRYFLRMGDQTLPADDYLHADLLTGRRARPSFELSKPSFDVADAVVAKSHRFVIHVSATNTSLVWVAKSILGMICYRHEDRKWERVGPALLAYVDDQEGAWGAHMAARGEHLEPLPPFGSATAGFIVEFPVPDRQDRTDRYTWRVVLYLLPENHPPSFWQLELSGSTRPHATPEIVVTALREGEAGVVCLAPA